MNNEFEEIIKKVSGRSKPSKEPDIPNGSPQNLNQENYEYRNGFSDGFEEGYTKGFKMGKEKKNRKR